MNYSFCFPSCHSQDITNVVNIQQTSSDVKCILCCTVLKLHIKGILSYSNKVKQQIYDHLQHCFKFMLHSQVRSHNSYSLFLNLLTLLCCIDLKISPWQRLQKKGWYKAFYKQGAWYYSLNKIKYCGDTPFNTTLTFVKLAVELLAQWL